MPRGNNLQPDEISLLCHDCGITFTVLADDIGDDDSIITCPSCGMMVEAPFFSRFERETEFID